MGDMRSCSDAGAVHFSQRSGAPQRTAEMNCKVLARESPSERAQNEWQGALNTTPSCHRRGNSGTWTKGSDRPSGEEIALSLIGWLGAAGAQISRFQEESGLVKWIGTVRALCVLFVRVCVWVCVSVFCV